MTSPTYPEPTDPMAAPQYPPAPDDTLLYPPTTELTPAPQYPTVEITPQYLPATPQYPPAPQYPPSPQYPPAGQYPPAPAYGPTVMPQGIPGQPLVIGLQVPVRPTSGAATASLVFGIVGILIGECLLGLPCLLAVIFGHIGLAQTKSGEKSGRGMAVAGLILGYIVVIPAAILTFAVWGTILGSAASSH
jgi:hypothetical protein